MKFPIQRHPMGGIQINFGRMFFWDIRQGYVYELFSLAWELKQINRIATPSEGV